MLTFAKLANALIYVTKLENQRLVNLLLGCVYEPLHLVDKTGTMYYVDKGTCSRLLSGERDVASQIQKNVENTKVLDNAKSYFLKRLIPEIKTVLIDDFLERMSLLIESDTSISVSKKRELLSLATKDSLADFLVSVTLYTIVKSNIAPIDDDIPNNLPERNLYFSGRSDQLDTIDRPLKSRKKVISICQKISGLGGVGKTQLAIEYGYRHLGDYKDGVWFLSAENSTTVFKSFLNLANLLKIKIPKEFQLEDLQREVKRWLAENHKWLLIVDNLESQADIEPYLPTKIYGKLIITTRNINIKLGECIPLDVFQTEESVDFLKRRFSETFEKKMESYKFSDFDIKAPLLAKRLGNFPLALEQAAAYIATVRCSITEYLALLAESGTDVFSDDYAAPEFYEKVVTTTWNISFQALCKSSQQLLNLCAYLAPDLIPVAFFVKERDKLPNPLKQDLSQKITTNRIVTELRTYSLTSGDADYINIHRLVQEVIRKKHL